MKAIALLIFALCALNAANALFGTKAPKSGCDPNNCKHKATCVLDTKNIMAQGKCICTAGFYGTLCENKDGCYDKPCKSGECIVNSLDKSKYTCKCPAGKVGEKCEKTDECSKNPCKNDGICKLDAKNKAVCTCKNGFTSKHCDKRNCTIVEFKGKHFSKLPKIYIDKSVEGKFKAFDAVASRCGITVQPIKSFSTQANTKLPVEIVNAPFYIGRALQFELLDANGKILCNSVCLAKKPIPTAPAKCFIEGVIANGWKYETQVIHDGTFNTQPLLYNTLRETAQVGCKDKKF